MSSIILHAELQLKNRQVTAFVVLPSDSDHYFCVTLSPDLRSMSITNRGSNVGLEQPCKVDKHPLKTLVSRRGQGAFVSSAIQSDRTNLSERILLGRLLHWRRTHILPADLVVISWPRNLLHYDGSSQWELGRDDGFLALPQTKLGKNLRVLKPTVWKRATRRQVNWFHWRSRAGGYKSYPPSWERLNRNPGMLNLESPTVSASRQCTRDSHILITMGNKKEACCRPNRLS